jgi:hypothetical protein
MTGLVPVVSAVTITGIFPIVLPTTNPVESIFPSICRPPAVKTMIASGTGLPLASRARAWSLIESPATMFRVRGVISIRAIGDGVSVGVGCGCCITSNAETRCINAMCLLSD